MRLSYPAFLLYQEQASYHRERDEVMRRMHALGQNPFGEKDKVEAEFNKLKADLASLQREFYGRY